METPKNALELNTPDITNSSNSRCIDNVWMLPVTITLGLIFSTFVLEGLCLGFSKVLPSFGELEPDEITWAALLFDDIQYVYAVQGCWLVVWNHRRIRGSFPNRWLIALSVVLTALVGMKIFLSLLVYMRGHGA